MVDRISKWILPIAIILLSLRGVLSQEYKNSNNYKDNTNTILYDLDGLPIWIDSHGYITLKGDTIARSDLQPLVDFDNDKNGFSDYIDSCYYNSSMYHDNETHFWITFHIIFNDNMKIEEIRLTGPASSYITPKLRSYLINCILKTDGRWIFKTKTYGTYAYVKTCMFY